MTEVLAGRGEPARIERTATRVARSGVRWRAALSWLLPALILALWIGATETRWVKPNLLPPPGAVVAVLIELWRSGDLWPNITATLGRVASGFVLGVAVATALGAATGHFDTARRVIDPTIQALRAIPSIAWVPLFILWLGIAEPSKVALIAVGVFFPVYLNLMAAIQGVDRKLIEVARACRMNGARLIFRILLPAALPGFVVGLRSGLGLGWMFVVAAELMGASEGVGYLMIDGQTTGRPALVIAALLLFAALGKLSDLILATLGRGALAWQDTVSGGPS